MGPWRHSQVNYDGYNLGPLKWDGDTALQFRRDVLKPFFDQYLKNGRAQGRHAAGLHLQHRREPLGPLEELAAGLRTGLRRAAEAALSGGGFRLGIRQAGRRREAASDSYVSDPAKPVPYLPRPVRFADSDRWKQWLVTRSAHGGRPHRRVDLCRRRCSPRRCGSAARRLPICSPPPPARTPIGW